MSEQSEKKVGIISCSGEVCVEGTISRIAARLVLEKLKPEKTVTICLPLFLAGGREERAFAGDYPAITVDGCKKLCAKIGTEHYSGKPASSIIVSDFTHNRKHTELGSRRTLNHETLIIAERIAEKIAEEVDAILKRWE